MNASNEVPGGAVGGATAVLMGYRGRRYKRMVTLLTHRILDEIQKNAYTLKKRV